MRASELARRLRPLAVRAARGAGGGGDDPELGRLRLHADRVVPGDLFAALPGRSVDGHAFVGAALGRGAAGLLLADPRLHPAAKRALDVPDAAGVAVLTAPPDALPRVAGEAAHLLAAAPSERLRVAAVTGTNGKTTVVHLVHQALAAAGEAALRMGTLGAAGPGVRFGPRETTPPGDLVHDALARAAVGGARYAVLEASSHGLDQERLAGVRLAAAAWTNLSRDHLDYHGDVAAYARAKGRIAELLADDAALLLPAADAAAWRATAAAPRRLAWSLEEGGVGPGASPSRAAAGVVRGRLLALDAEGLRLRVEGDLGAARLVSPRVGRHDAENLVVAWALLRLLGVDAAAAAAGLAVASGAPGRLQRVAPEAPFRLYVDFAHTPDALARVLAALREVHRGARIGVVFGAGGDRDPGKRPRMGEAVGRVADWCIVTSDNPRSEDPAAVAAAVAAGVRSVGLEPEVVLDRAEAIAAAVARLAPGDVLLVAGKGHETTQEIAGVHHPFDDRRVLEEACSCLR